MALISTVTDAGTSLNAQALRTSTPGAVTRIELGTGHVTTAALARAVTGIQTPFTPRRESVNPPVFAEAGNSTAQVTYFDSSEATFNYNELAIFVGTTCIYYECDSEGAVIGSKGADALQKSVAFTYSNGDAALVAREYVVLPLATESNMGLVQLADSDTQASDIAVPSITRVRRLVNAAGRSVANINSLIAAWVSANPVPGVTPAGTINAFAGTTAPAGYLVCDGRPVSRTTYRALFAAIGTGWGAGNGSTTFNVPDLRRRTLVGTGGTGTRALGSVVGNRGGEESHTLTEAETPAHTHGQAGDHRHPIPRLGNAGGTLSLAVANARNIVSDIQTGAAGTHAHTSFGGGQAHNVIQPSAVVNYIIKT